MLEFSSPEVLLLLGRMGGGRARRIVVCAEDKPSKFNTAERRGLSSCASTLRRDDVRLGVVVSQTNTYVRSVETVTSNGGCYQPLCRVLLMTFESCAAPPPLRNKRSSFVFNG